MQRPPNLLLFGDLGGFIFYPPFPLAPSGDQPPSCERRKESRTVKSKVHRQPSRIPSAGDPKCFQAVSLRAVLCGFFLLILSLPCAASAATIEGSVFDPSGRAIPGARVSLLESQRPLDERRTDAKGAYQFAGLRAGNYEVVATSPGFTTLTVKVVAQEGQISTQDLHLQLSAVSQQVVVSASLGGALVPQIGSSVSVVTGQDMKDRGAQSVLEVLRGVPGVEVNQTGRRGGVTGVFVRGGNSNYNEVMIDGIPLNQFGGDFDFAPLPVDGVERIEVTRGPESALYGTNAVTSVINIVTHRGDGPPRFTFLAEGGSYTTRRFSTGGSGLTHGLSWSYNLSRLDTGGVVQNDQYRDQTAFLSLGYHRNPRRQLDFHFLGNANDAGAPGPFGSDPLHLYDAPMYPGGPTPRQVGLLTRDKQNMFGYQGSYSEQLSSRFRQVTTASVATNDYYFRSPFGDSYSNNLRAVFNTRSEVAVSTKDFLVGGFEYNREQTENTYIADANNNPFLLPRTSLAYFVENRWSPTRRLYVMAGLRADNLRTGSLPPDAFGTRPFLPATSIVKLNPRVSVAYLVHEGSSGGRFGLTRLHGSFGTGIRAPSGFELAFTNNPDLKPERTVSYDAGIEQQLLGSKLVADITYFQNRFHDQIVVLGSSLTNLSSFISANLANSRAEGLEMSFRAHPTRSLDFSAEYTLLAASILALDGATMAQYPFRVGQPLLRRPRNSAAYNVTWHHGKLMLNTNAYIRGEVLDIEPNIGTSACTLGLQCFFTNPGYIRADAGFSYRLARSVEIYGRLNNFLNQKYEESFGYPALHLNFLTGIRLSFPAE